MPYRVDLRASGDDVLDRLVDLGALDVEFLEDGSVAALMPDAMTPAQVAQRLGIPRVSVSRAIGRDAGSVWVLGPRPTRLGRLSIVPDDGNAEPGVLRLRDGEAFGTGLHPTTALCVEAIDDEAASASPAAILDVGTGSGVLALAALVLGVPAAVGIDIDDKALLAAGANAGINGLSDRLQLARGGPDALVGTWPLVVANVLAAPLIEMAPHLVRRVGRRGRLILSGVAVGVEADVEGAYRRHGMRPLRVMSRAGWSALILGASW